jgi:hypothetical protein
MIFDESDGDVIAGSLSDNLILRWSSKPVVVFNNVADVLFILVQVKIARPNHPEGDFLSVLVHPLSDFAAAGDASTD